MRIEKYERFFKLDRSQKKDFLYPLMFRESIYTLIHDRGFGRVILFENRGFDNQFRLLIVKRLIAGIDQRNSPLFFNDSNKNRFVRYNKKLYSKKIAEVFSIIVEIPFSLQFQQVSSFTFEELEIVKSHNLRSLHSIFSFLEGTFSHLNYVLDLRLPYPVHLEKLVQTIRYWARDPSYLHLLRLFLHGCGNSNPLIMSKKSSSFFAKGNPKFFLFLYNSYVYECESIFFFLRNQSSHLRLNDYRVFLERISFYVKRDHFAEVIANDLADTLCLFKDFFTHYIRYQGKSILASKNPSFLMEKWKYYLVILCQYHFDVWFQPERIHMNAFSKHSLDLLGYRSSLRLNLSVVRSQMLEISCLIDNFMYNLDTGIPIIPLMRSLAKMKFCKTAGHPISKSNWADSSDSDIIRRFVHIGRNLSHYYSGSSKKMSLYRIHYILRFSCIKTLAHKHKSSVRAFLKKLGSEFFEDFFAHEESIFFSRASSISQRLCRRRVWHLDILSINEMLN